MLNPYGGAAILEFRKIYRFVNLESKAIQIATDIIAKYESMAAEQSSLSSDLYVPAQYANDAIKSKKRIVLTVGGVARFAIVPLSDLESLDEIDNAKKAAV